MTDKTKKKIVKVEPRRKGAPEKADSERQKPRTFNMNDQLWKRITDEAEARQLDISEFGRQVWDWYFTMLDTKRGDTETSKMFEN